MKTQKRFIPFLLAAVILLAIACKEKQTSEGDPKPEIALIKVTPTTIKQFSDTIEVTISYKDGDGDLGDLNPDENSFEIKDSRLTKADYYFFSPLAPKDAKIKIQGNLKMKLKNMFLLGTGNVETCFLDIRIKDRAGNWSNTVRTPELTISK